MLATRTALNKHVLIRFFHVEAAYRREISMYRSGALEGIAVPLLLAEAPETRHDDEGGVVYTPAYIITETGLSLKEVLTSQSLTTPESVDIWLEAANLVHTLTTHGWHYGIVVSGNLQWMSADEAWRLQDLSNVAEVGGKLPAALPLGQGPPEYAVAREKGVLEEGVGMTSDGIDTLGLGSIGLGVFTG